MCIYCMSLRPVNPRWRIRTLPRREVRKSRAERAATACMVGVGALLSIAQFALLVAAPRRGETALLGWVWLGIAPHVALDAVLICRPFWQLAHAAIVGARSEALQLGPPVPGSGDAGWITEHGVQYLSLLYRWDHFTHYELDAVEPGLYHLVLWPQGRLLPRKRRWGFTLGLTTLWQAVIVTPAAVLGFRHYGWRADVLAAVVSAAQALLPILTIICLLAWVLRRRKDPAKRRPPPDPVIVALNAEFALRDELEAFLDARLPRQTEEPTAQQK